MNFFWISIVFIWSNKRSNVVSFKTNKFGFLLSPVNQMNLLHMWRRSCFIEMIWTPIVDMSLRFKIPRTHLVVSLPRLNWQLICPHPITVQIRFLTNWPLEPRVRSHRKSAQAVPPHYIWVIFNFLYSARIFCLLTVWFSQLKSSGKFTSYSYETYAALESNMLTFWQVFEIKTGTSCHSLRQARLNRDENQIQWHSNASNDLPSSNMIDHHMATLRVVEVMNMIAVFRAMIKTSFNEAIMIQIQNSRSWNQIGIDCSPDNGVLSLLKYLVVK